jgi:hypothetical protein
MYVLQAHSPQESFLYDHPYFGQLFLAAVFTMIGYPNSLHPTSNGDMHSIEMLYMIPRILMGILAILDTFLIYKIAECRYNSRNVGLIASVLFAVMPITWLTRLVFVESIQLPFLLLSILFAIYTKKVQNKNTHVLSILLSGIFLGLAIFTKIPVFTMIPLIGFLIFTNNNRNLKCLGLWFMPVILIPLIWPGYALSVGQFDLWLDGVYGQTHRGKNTLFYSLNYDFKIDSVLLVFGTAGLLFATINRDFFLLLWFIPFLIFLYFIGFVSYWHIVPLIPAFSVAAARLITELSNKIKNKQRAQQILPFAIILGVGIFGLVNITLLITMSNSSPYFKAVAFIAQYLENNKNAENNNKKVTIIANPFYEWIPEYVFHLDHDYIGYYDDKPVTTRKVLSIFDYGLIDRLNHHQAAIQMEKIQENSNLYSSRRIAKFEGEAPNYDRVSIYLYDSNASTITTSFKTYGNSTYGIGIQYPSNWEIDTHLGSEQDNIIHAVDFRSPYENDSDRFADFVAIDIEKLSTKKNMKLDKYADSIINSDRESFPSFNLIESNTNSTTLAGFPAYRLQYTLPYQRFGEDDINIKAMEIGTIIDGRAYALIYYAEAAKYDSYLPIIQKIINSFKITK